MANHNLRPYLNPIKSALASLVLGATVNSSLSGSVGLPTERLAIPFNGTSNNLVLIWNHSDNRWENYNRGQFEPFEGHTISYDVPSWNKWYCIRIWDKEQRTSVYQKWVGHFTSGGDSIAEVKPLEKVASTKSSLMVTMSNPVPPPESERKLGYSLLSTGNNPFGRTNLDQILPATEYFNKNRIFDMQGKFNSDSCTVMCELGGLETSTKRYILQFVANNKLIKSSDLRVFDRGAAPHGLVFHNDGININPGDTVSSFLLDTKLGYLYDLGRDFTVTRGAVLFLKSPDADNQENLVGSISSVYECVTDANARLNWGIPLHSNEFPSVFLDTDTYPFYLTWNGTGTRDIFAKEKLTEPWVQVKSNSEFYMVPTEKDTMFYKASTTNSFDFF